MKQLITIILMGLLLSACASEPLKAPCNEDGSFCGTKVKINRW